MNIIDIKLNNLKGKFMTKHLNTVFPIIAFIDKLFGKTKDELRALYTENKIEVPKNFEINLEENKSLGTNVNNIDNKIPGAVKIPLQTLLDAGFTIDCYLKDDTEHCIDDKNGSGVIILNIQHNDPKSCSMVDGLSMSYDPITEIEISTLNSVILNKQIPGVFGPRYNIDDAMKYSSVKIQNILDEREEAREIMLEKMEEYNKNPEKREKDTKKAVENLMFKFSKLKHKESADKSKEFTSDALKILGSIAGINNLQSFDQLKEIPIFKKEIDAGGSFSELLSKFCDMAKALQPKAD